MAVPTGYPKAYAFTEMVKSIKALSHDPVDTVFAVTLVEGNQNYADFHERVKRESGDWAAVITTTMSPEEKAKPYYPITVNRQAIRSFFLDGDYDELLLCGGDNPPHPDVYDRLHGLHVDVALGTSYQRPSVSRVSGNSYPLLYAPIWMPEEVFSKYPRLEAANREQFIKIFRSRPFLAPYYSMPELHGADVLLGIVGGDGNGLYSRRVLESCGWVYPEWSSHSEDIHLMIDALSKGFTTAAQVSYHVRHLDPDGGEY